MSHAAWRLALPLTVLAVLAALPATARGQVRESLTVDEAAMVFQEVATIPEAGIPVALLQSAEGFAIIPSVIKAGFIVGGRFGRGVIVVRDAQTGGWSNPIFVTLAGGGVGFQVGAQATDLILVFRSRQSIESFLRGRGQFTLGADAGVAAGPVGRQVAAGTDVTLRAEILSYSRSRGLFAGVSLEGASLKLDWKANVAYYGEVLPTSTILATPDLPAPESATRLRAVVTRLSTPVVVVPLQPGVTGPGLEPIPADEFGPLPPPSEALPPTARLQSADGPVLISTPTGTPAARTPSRVAAAASSTATAPAATRVVARTDPATGRLVYYVLPPGTTLARSATPRQPAANASNSSTLRSTPQGSARIVAGWKRVDGGDAIRRR